MCFARILLFILILSESVAIGNLQVVPELPPSDPQDLKVFRKIESIYLKNTRWDGDIELALKDLSIRSREGDPNHEGVRCVLKVGSNPPKKSKFGYPITRRVSILLLNATSLHDLLAYISEQTGIPYKLQDGTVVFSP